MVIILHLISTYVQYTVCALYVHHIGDKVIDGGYIFWNGTETEVVVVVYVGCIIFIVFIGNILLPGASAY